MPVILISSSLLSRHILQISDSISDMGSVSWQIVLCLVLAWIIVYLCLFKGVASSGKVSHDHLSAIFIFLYYKGIRILESRKWLLVESGPLQIFVLEFAIKLKKSGIALTIGNRNPNSTDKESGIHYLESGIHSVESRTQDCLGFPYMEW